MTITEHPEIPPRPKRGFDPDEYAARVQKAQAILNDARLDAVVVTTAHNIRYFTGFDSQFWESPTRPWFVIVARDTQPIAVIPEIGGPAMESTWLDDVRTWQAPCPEDDGVKLLTDALKGLSKQHARIGFEMGREMPMRLPMNEFFKIRDLLPGYELVDGSAAVWRARMVKSEAEVERIRYSAMVASIAYEQLAGWAHSGMSEREVNNRLTQELLTLGADAVPFLPVIAGPGGQSQIVVGPGERRLAQGDVMFIDTGVLYDGYFCDFDRNWTVGEVGADAHEAYDVVWRAAEAAIEAVRPGMTSHQLCEIQGKVLETLVPLKNNVGRLGHGLGMQLTEPPSHMPGDHTVFEENMVLTIEPGLEYAPGKMLVLEENIVLRADGAEMLSKRAPREMWQLDLQH